MLAFRNLLLACTTLIPSVWCSSRNKTCTNRTYDIFPEWNANPSCTFVKEWDDAFFCTTSSFHPIPGAPVYASKDMWVNTRYISSSKLRYCSVKWRLASHALSRPSQLPQVSNPGQQQEGIWASKICLLRQAYGSRPVQLNSLSVYGTAQVNATTRALVYTRKMDTIISCSLRAAPRSITRQLSHDRRTSQARTKAIPKILS